MTVLDEKELKKILKPFRERTQIYCSILFDEDGSLITTEKQEFDEDDQIHQGISAIFANLLSIAEDGISFLKLRTNVKQLIIQAGVQGLEEDAFTVVIESITKNYILSVIFPSNLNNGVILFEIKGIIQKLLKYINSTK